MLSVVYICFPAQIDLYLWIKRRNKFTFPSNPCHYVARTLLPFKFSQTWGNTEMTETTALTDSASWHLNQGEETGCWCVVHLRLMLITKTLYGVRNLAASGNSSSQVSWEVRREVGDHSPHLLTHNQSSNAWLCRENFSDCTVLISPILQHDSLNWGNYVETSKNKLLWVSEFHSCH